MLNSMNLQGRLATEPKLKTTNERERSVTFSLAVERSDGSKRTDFFNCISFGSTAKFIADRLHKGNAILLQGRLETEEYTNSEGRPQRRVVIVGEKVYFIANSPRAPDKAADPS